MEAARLSLQVGKEFERTKLFLEASVNLGLTV